MINNVRSTNSKFETLRDKIKIFSNFIDSTIIYIYKTKINYENWDDIQFKL